jgi:hypothetical protein
MYLDVSPSFLFMIVQATSLARSSSERLWKPFTQQQQVHDFSQFRSSSRTEYHVRGDGFAVQLWRSCGASEWQHSDGRYHHQGAKM